MKFFPQVLAATAAFAFQVYDFQDTTDHTIVLHQIGVVGGSVVFAVLRSGIHPIEGIGLAIVCFALAFRVRDRTTNFVFSTVEGRMSRCAIPWVFGTS
jgi:hypothetical protein